MGVYIPQDANAVYRMIPPSILNELGAVIVPTPHGRLIDADELKKKKYHSDITHENAVAVAEIDWLPTVIDAEE